MKCIVKIILLYQVVSSTFSQIPTTGLIAYFPFTGNANDETGNGRNGTVHGATLTTDRFGTTNSAYSFNGASDYISASAEGLPASDRTVSFWFYANQINNKPALFGYGGGACGTSWIHSINTTGSGLMSLAGHCGINDLGYSYPSAPIGAWHHWVITTSSTGTKMYYDNVLVQSNSNYVTNTNISEKDLIIGGCVAPSGVGTYTDGNVSFFDGAIDDIRIYNRELNSSEISELYDEALPVELISFSASVLDNIVFLEWQTATEVNNYGFEIERKSSSEAWQTISFVEGAGTTNSAKGYLYRDSKPTNGKNYYRLKQIDQNGRVDYSREIEAISIQFPKVFSLEQNFPNPFNPSTTIKFGLPEASAVTLKIYDVTGREVSMVVNSQLAAGYYSYRWNAGNLSSGIYFYRLTAVATDRGKKQMFNHVRKLLFTK